MKRAARGLPFRAAIALVSGAPVAQTGLRADELGEEALTLLPARLDLSVTEKNQIPTKAATMENSAGYL